MQLYYIIEKHDTEQIRLGKTEVEKFSQNIAKGFDSYSAVRMELESRCAELAKGREVLQVERNEYGTIRLATFCDTEFHKDSFGNMNKSTIEIFLTKAVF